MTAITILSLLLTLGCGDDLPDHAASLKGSASSLVVPLIDSEDRFSFVSDEFSIDLSSARARERITSQLLQLENGWYKKEKWGVWARGETSTVLIYMRAPRDRLLVIDCHSISGPRRRKGQTVGVTWNGTACGSLKIGRRFKRHYLPIPEEIQQDGLNRLDFSYSFHATSKSLGFGKDTRDLAVAFRSIGVRLGSEKPGLLARLKERLQGSDERLPEHDVSRNRLVLRGSGSIVTGLQLPENAGSIKLTARAVGISGVESPSLQVKIIRLDGTSNELGFPMPAPGTPGSDQTLIAGAHSIRELAGEACLLAMHAELGSAKQIELISPEVRLERGHESHSAPELDDTANQYPDIILITLDAARADHFGCYGYSRPTTPQIDKLAAESLVFDNAFALAPYTLCSVPTMLTGLSFIDHGIVAQGVRIDDQAHTLAEYLHEVGYRTVCFTGLPNNSARLGLDQGYDEFHEFWRTQRGKARHDPFRFNQMVLKLLADDDSSRPLHLQLHYLPPHEPYHPPETFDIFTDPDYQGGFDGTLLTKTVVNSRESEPDPADIHHIEALYDGNLRVADHVVGEVIEALRARPSWSRTVVLITADHGEAMYEHGMIGHNYSVYDEMLRVPFILRLPNQLVTAGIDTGRLVSLADIVPTLLAAVPLQPKPGLTGVNLLSEPAVDSRYLLLRSSRMTRIAFALRTEDWKVVVSGEANMELYDLTNDPGEQSNLAADRLLISAGLAKLLSRRLGEAPVATLARPQSGLDDDDRAMLEELGYLEGREGR